MRVSCPIRRRSVQLLTFSGGCADLREVVSSLLALCRLFIFPGLKTKKVGGRRQFEDSSGINYKNTCKFCRTFHVVRKYPGTGYSFSHSSSDGCAIPEWESDWQLFSNVDILVLIWGGRVGEGGKLKTKREGAFRGFICINYLNTRQFSTNIHNTMKIVPAL